MWNLILPANSSYTEQTNMTEWRKKVAQEKKAEREERESAALQAAEAGPPHQGIDSDGSRSTDNKWMQQPSQDDLHHQQQFHQQQEQQQQQMSDMAQASMFNPYLQAAAFGGQMDPRTAALGLNSASNPYLSNPYMQGAGNPALSLFGRNSPARRKPFPLECFLVL